MEPLGFTFKMFNKPVGFTVESTKMVALGEEEILRIYLVLIRPGG
jgi:hypothetical protein